MPELCPLACTPRTSGAKVRVAELAARQWGVVTRAQLEQCGLEAAGMSRWQDERRLHRVYPGVYAVGHACARNGRKAGRRLVLRRAGGCAQSHDGGVMVGNPASEPRRLHVTTPGKRVSLPGVRVHCRRSLERRWHERLPVTPPAQTLLDIASQVRFQELRRALAEAEYLKLLTMTEVEAVLGRGKPGSATLRAALECHNPRLARTKRGLEEKFLLLCERHSLTSPDVNVWVAGWLVDAVWFERTSRRRARQPPRPRHAVEARKRPPPRSRTARRRLHRAALHLAAGHADAGARRGRSAPRATSVTCRGRSRSRPCGPSRRARTGAPCPRRPRSCPRYP